MADSDKTEKATPKRREEARKKGQVPKSADANGAAVLIAALASLVVFGGSIATGLMEGMRASLGHASDPGIVNQAGVGKLLMGTGLSVIKAVGPVAVPCFLAGLVASVAQVGFKPSAEAVKPDPKRMSPIQGAKNIFGINAVFEALKSTTKVALVGGIAALALLPNLSTLAALVGVSPASLGSELVRGILNICWKAAAAYALIAAADVFWQRHRHEKQLMMRTDEVRREHKESALSPEVRAALKRRQNQMAKTRMMTAVPGADVVVTNPTHYAVALAYDGSRGAPVVAAKGKDLVAAEIRRVAREHGVPVVENPPLARSLHGAVEVGEEIGEDLYQAVAELLAFVYRAAGRVAA